MQQSETVALIYKHLGKQDPVQMQRLVRLVDAVVAAERERWQKACGAIAGDLRNHDMVRLGAAKCLDAGNRA